MTAEHSRPELVIELGLLEPGAPAAGQVASRSGPPGWWPRLRPVMVSGLLAMLAIGLVADGVPPPTGVVTIPLPSRANGQFEVLGDLLLVAEPERGWTAYELATGARRWTLDRPTDWSSGLVAGGGVLWDGAVPLDPATGQPLTPGLAAVPDRYGYLGVAGERTLLATGQDLPDADVPVDPRLADQLSGIDAFTGEVRWRTTPDPGVEVSLLGNPPTVVAISRDGTVTLRDLATGVVRASRALPEPASPIAVAGGHLVLRAADQPAVRGYAVDTFTERWEFALPDPDAVSEPCGPMLCVHGEQPPDGGDLGYDPVTGDLHWQHTRTELVDPATGRLAWATRASLYPVGDRFLAYDADGPLRELRDAQTGKSLRDLTGWRPVVPATAQPWYLSRLTLLRHLTRAGPTVVAELDLVSLELTEVRRLPTRPVHCEGTAEVLVCRHGGRLWVWTL